MSKFKTILLVCTGNSCRSVMAGGLLQKMLKGKGDYKIMTAGTIAIKGMQPTAETIQVMSEQSIDVSHHQSSPLNDELIDEADIILVMEQAHKENILRRRPAAKDKVHLLNEFGRIKKEHKLVDPDVPDPVGRSLEFYRRVFEIIRESALRTVKKLSGD